MSLSGISVRAQNPNRRDTPARQILVRSAILSVILLNLFGSSRSPVKAQLNKSKRIHKAPQNMHRTKAKEYTKLSRSWVKSVSEQTRSRPPEQTPGISEAQSNNFRSATEEFPKPTRRNGTFFRRKV
ncbi:MAG: hypothetical protein V4721_03655 [Bacteroidota bacterium]